MLTIRAMSDGKGYSSRHLEHSDYYTEGERVVGRWRGRGAKLLGLSGEVTTTDFEALRQGLDPKTNEFLRQRKSADRTASDGRVQSHARHLYDFTISAPKSVSVMAILGGDSRLVQAHENAVTEALTELESCALARVRKSRANEDRITGNMVIAVYRHDTSRELDPQLHTHAVAANLTYDGAEGSWKALKPGGIYERRSYLTEVYRNALAREVRALGYEIENQRDGKGRDNGFEIRGIPRRLLDRYSQRSRQRDEAIGRFIAEKGRPPTDNEVAVLVRESRADKLIEISTKQLRKQQFERLTPEDVRVLNGLHPKRTAALSVAPAERSFEFAKDKVFERVSVACDHVILTEALKHGRGEISHADLKGILAFQELSGKVLRHADEIATDESLRRETVMIECVNRGTGALGSLRQATPFVVSDRLSPEQKHAVEFVLGSHDRFVNISGAAGTGKTDTLQEIRRGLVESGHGIVAIAPTMSAVEELLKVGFTNAISIERLLQDKSGRPALDCKVIIVDEAGMVSGRQMSALLELAEEHSARIVFSGDTKQIQSVESCDALRVLEKESRLKSVALTEVRRQADRAYRDAIQELRRDPGLGFQKLDAIGSIHEVAWTDRPQAVAEAFAEFKSQGRDALVVCATHDEIDRVTEAIRSFRKRAGQLGTGVELTRDVPLSWTSAQKRDVRNLRLGQILGFHRAVKGIGRNETAEVVRVDRNQAIVRTGNDELRAITGKQSKSFDVYDRRAVEVAAGDKLLLTANRRAPGFRATNGEIVTVGHIDCQRRIHLEDGRMLPDNFRHFTHGYAVTAHRSQGKTVDAVIISADGMRRELFYVAASRGRERALVITSNKEQLLQSVGRSAARQSATELERKLHPGLHQGICRGLAAARRLAMWAAQHFVPSLSRNLEPRYQQIIPRRKERSHDFGMER